jgi:hypothetical protein
VPDPIDDLVNQASLGSEGTQQGDVPGGDDQQNRRDGRDFQSRINALTAKRKEAEERFDGLQNQFSQRLDSIEELIKSSIGKPAPPAEEPTSPSSWQEFSPAQLQQAVEHALENNNGPALFQAMKEQNRRMAEEAVSQATERATASIQDQQYRAGLRNQVIEEYGQEAVNSDSDLNRRAQQYYASAVQKYGKERVEQTPDIEYACFTRAWKDLHAGDSQTITDLQSQLDQMKRDQEMERSLVGRSMGRAPSEEVKGALDKGDTKNAIRSLGTVKSMSGKAMMDLRRR